MTSFVERLAKEPKPSNSQNIGEIFLVKGKDSTGRSAWYYIRIPISKMIVFERIEGSCGLNLNDWGTILRSGYGMGPPGDIRRWAEEELGFRDTWD